MKHHKSELNFKLVSVENNYEEEEEGNKVKADEIDEVFGFFVYPENEPDKVERMSSVGATTHDDDDDTPNSFSARSLSSHSHLSACSLPPVISPRTITPYQSQLNFFDRPSSAMSDIYGQNKPSAPQASKKMAWSEAPPIQTTGQVVRDLARQEVAKSDETPKLASLSGTRTPVPILFFQTESPASASSRVIDRAPIAKAIKTANRRERESMAALEPLVPRLLSPRPEDIRRKLAIGGHESDSNFTPNGKWCT